MARALMSRGADPTLIPGTIPWLQAMGGGGIGSDAARAPSQSWASPYSDGRGYNPYDASIFGPAAQGNLGGRGMPTATAGADGGGYIPGSIPWMQAMGMGGGIGSDAARAPYQGGSGGVFDYGARSTDGMMPGWQVPQSWYTQQGTGYSGRADNGVDQYGNPTDTRFQGVQPGGGLPQWRDPGFGNYYMGG